MKSPVHHVSRLVGMNPIAQAVARQRLRSSVLDMKIALLMLTRGEPCADLLIGLAAIMQAMQIALQAQKLEGLEVNILKGGLNACLQQVQANFYDPDQTVAITAGLDACLTLVGRVKPQAINDAWASLTKGSQ